MILKHKTDLVKLHLNAITFRNVRGVASLDGILTKMMDTRIHGAEPVSQVMNVKFRKVSKEASLAKLCYILQGGHFAFVTENGIASILQIPIPI